MKYLLKAIKTTVGATSSLSGLVNRIFVNEIGEIEVTDGPYARVILIDDRCEFGFADTTGYDEAYLQFSVFASTMTGADTLVDEIIKAFNGVSISLDTGKKAAGLRVKRGFAAEPRAKDETQVFHAYCEIKFTYEDYLA